MKKIIALAGSISSDSINKKLINEVSTYVETVDVEVLQLEDYLAGFYSSDEEKAKGVPKTILALKEKFKQADGFIISSPEYNGHMSAAFKNTIDWLTRIERSIFGDKPTVVLSTSPGATGGASVMEAMLSSFPRFGANIVASYSLGLFHEAYTDGALNDEKKKELKEVVTQLEIGSVKPQYIYK